jgi:hypothetical protein
VAVGCTCCTGPGPTPCPDRIQQWLQCSVSNDSCTTSAAAKVERATHPGKPQSAGPEGRQARAGHRRK